MTGPWLYTLQVDTICLRSLADLYELVESNQFDAVGHSLSVLHRDCYNT